MKITFIKPEIAENGGSRVVGIYALKLLKKGHDVTVVGRAPQPIKLETKARALLKGRRPKVPSLTRTRFFDGLGDRLIELDYTGPLRPEDVPDGDVIIATWWRTAFEVASLPPEKGKKAYFIQHHEVFPNLPWDISAGSYYLPLKKITIAEWLVDTMAELYDDKNVPLVLNSVDTDQFNAAPRARNAAPRVGLMYSSATFKGIDVSLKAIELAQKRIPDLRVVSFGAPDINPALPLPPDSEYHKLPAQDALRDIYAKCDVWLCGSHAEGFHLPPLEAMACRVPVVSTRVGGAVETVTEGVTGYLADTGDAEGLAEGLIKVLSKSPEDWRTMSDAAYARAHGYTWDDATDAFEAELFKIAKDG